MPGKVHICKTCRFWNTENSFRSCAGVSGPLGNWGSHRCNFSFEAICHLRASKESKINKSILHKRSSAYCTRTELPGSTMSFKIFLEDLRRKKEGLSVLPCGILVQMYWRPWQVKAKRNGLSGCTGTEKKAEHKFTYWAAGAIQERLVVGLGNHQKGS